MFQPFARRSLWPQSAYICPSCLFRRPSLAPRLATYSTFLDNTSIQDIHKALDAAESRPLNKTRGNRAASLFEAIGKTKEVPKVPIPLQLSHAGAGGVDDHNVATSAASKRTTTETAVPKTTTPEKAVTKSATSKKATSKKITSKKPASKEAAPKKATPKKATSKKAAPERTASEGGEPELAAPEKVPSKRTAKRRATPKTTAPEIDVPETAISERVVREKAGSERATSKRAARKRAIRRKATPERDVSERVVPEGAAPEGAAPERVVRRTAHKKAGSNIIRSKGASLELAAPATAALSRDILEAAARKPATLKSTPSSTASKRRDYPEQTPQSEPEELPWLAKPARGPRRLVCYPSLTASAASGLRRLMRYPILSAGAARVRYSPFSRPLTPRPRIKRVLSNPAMRLIKMERSRFPAKLSFLKAPASSPRKSFFGRNILGNPGRRPKGLPRDATSKSPFIFKPTVEELDAQKLSLVPLDIGHAPVPPLSYGLDRVLFNPGVYNLQDQRTHVYNFDPYLQTIMPVSEFNFGALKEYVTSSRDTVLSSLARDFGKRYVGSTSSMTAVLGHFHFLLSNWREISLNMLSQGFPEDYRSFTQLTRNPSAVFLKYNDGVYAIDADKAFDRSTILSSLGKSMEKLLTLETGSFERYRKSNPDAMTQEEENKSPEAFHYSTIGDFLMRSQLDAQDPRLPGTGMFDLKTRAVVSVRMDSSNYEDMKDYQIKGRFGKWESYEREYYDMIRSTFLKYSLQVRMGRMDGIFVAFHNTERIFGFQYIPLAEMDLAIHGQANLALGDQEFKLSVDLLNKILDKATKRFPEQSIRLHFETRDATNTFMYIFAEPVTDEEMLATQTRANSKIEEFKRQVLEPDEATESQTDEVHAHVQETMYTGEAGDEESAIFNGRMHKISDSDDNELDPTPTEFQNEEMIPMGASAKNESTTETYNQVKTGDAEDLESSNSSVFDPPFNGYQPEAAQESLNRKTVDTQADTNAGDPDVELSVNGSDVTIEEPTVELERPPQQSSEQECESDSNSLGIDGAMTLQSSSDQDTLRADQADIRTSPNIEDLGHDDGLDEMNSHPPPAAALERDGTTLPLSTSQNETCFKLQDVHTSEHAQFYFDHLMFTFHGDELVRRSLPLFAQKGVVNFRPEKDGSWDPISYFNHLRNSFWKAQKNRLGFNLIQRTPPPGYKLERLWVDGDISIAHCLRQVLTAMQKRRRRRKIRKALAAKRGSDSTITSSSVTESSPDSTSTSSSVTESSPDPTRTSSSVTESSPHPTSDDPPSTLPPPPADTSADTKSKNPNTPRRLRQSSLPRPKPLLAIVLSVQHKVNNEYVERANNINYVGDKSSIQGMSAHGPFPEASATNTKWAVEYQMKEAKSPQRAWQLYEICKERRRKLFETIDARDNPDNNTVNGYIEMLRKMSRNGKAYKEQMARKQRDMGEKRVLGRAPLRKVETEKEEEGGNLLKWESRG